MILNMMSRMPLNNQEKLFIEPRPPLFSDTRLLRFLLRDLNEEDDGQRDRWHFSWRERANS